MRTKTWVKDKYFEYTKGDIVKLVRKKKNNHPKSLQLGASYKIIKIVNDDLVVALEVFTKEQNSTGLEVLAKVHKSYFAPIGMIRDELINDIFRDD